MAKYKGYSSTNYEENGVFSLTDIKLVEYDLLNHLFTRKGERVRMPGYGTIIPDLVFEVLDEYIVDIVYEQLELVVNQDPRLKLLSLSVTPDFELGSISVQMFLQYVELNTTGNIDFYIEFSG